MPFFTYSGYDITVIGVESNLMFKYEMKPKCVH